MAAVEGHQAKLLDEEYGDEKLGSTTGLRSHAQRCFCCTDAFSGRLKGFRRRGRG